MRRMKATFVKAPDLVELRDVPVPEQQEVPLATVRPCVTVGCATVVAQHAPLSITSSSRS